MKIHVSVISWPPYNVEIAENKIPLLILFPGKVSFCVLHSCDKIHVIVGHFCEKVHMLILLFGNWISFSACFGNPLVWGGFIYLNHSRLGMRHCFFHGLLKFLANHRSKRFLANLRGRRPGCEFKFSLLEHRNSFFNVYAIMVRQGVTFPVILKTTIFVCASEESCFPKLLFPQTIVMRHQLQPAIVRLRCYSGSCWNTQLVHHTWKNIFQDGHVERLHNLSLEIKAWN